MNHRLGIIALSLSLLTGCFNRVEIVVTATPSPPASLTPEPGSPAAATPTPPGQQPATPVPNTPIPTTATAAPVSGAPLMWMAPYVPPVLQDALDPLVAAGRVCRGAEKARRIRLVGGEGGAKQTRPARGFWPVVAVPALPHAT